MPDDTPDATAPERFVLTLTDERGDVHEIMGLSAAQVLDYNAGRGISYFAPEPDYSVGEDGGLTEREDLTPPDERTSDDQ